MAKSLLSRGISSYLQYDRTKLSRYSGHGEGVGLVLISVMSTIILGILFYRAFFHPLSRIPGPPLAAITGWWRTYRYFRGTWHEDVLKVHEKYGRVVRIAPDEVSVVDSQAVRQLYSHGKSAKKSDWYHTWDVPGPVSAFFAETDPYIHSRLRKRVSAAYSMSSILRFEKHIQSCLDLCFSKFKKYADAGATIDISDWTNALTFDVVGELCFGGKLGHLRTESDYGGLREGIGKGFYLVSNFGHFWGQMKPLNSFVGKKIMTTLVGAGPLDDLRHFSRKRLEERRADLSCDNREDMLAHFLKMKSLDGTQPATDEEILVEVMNIVGAGADTTSIGMRSCIYYLGKHPSAYKRLQEEIDEYYESRNLQEPVNYTQSQQMPYLKAVVSESLRLFPSIVYQLLRISPGISINNRYIPAGYSIGISAIAQNRDKGVYGEDANEFRPERWLESEERVSSYDRINMTFGGNGPRTCVGRSIALVEIHKFIAQLLRNFNVEFIDKETPWHVRSFWFAHQTDMQMRIKIRPGRSIPEVDE